MRSLRLLVSLLIMLASAVALAEKAADESTGSRDDLLAPRNVLGPRPAVRAQSPDQYCDGDSPCSSACTPAANDDFAPLELFTDDSLLEDLGAIDQLDASVLPEGDLLSTEPTLETKAKRSGRFLIEQPPTRERRSEAQPIIWEGNDKADPYAPRRIGRHAAGRVASSPRHRIRVPLPGKPASGTRGASSEPFQRPFVSRLCAPRRRPRPESWRA